MQQPQYLWDRLHHCGQPVVLYGMGDGADKILARCAEHGIAVAAVFASDGFVRGQTYRGYPVQTLAAVEAAYPELLILLSFATQRPEVLAAIRGIAARHTLLAPDVPVVGDVMITPEYLRDHREEIEAVEALLADELSRRVFRNVLRYKLTGEPALLWDCESPRAEALGEILRPGPGERFVDAGAYTGDTIEELLGYTRGRYRSILALEPDRRNFAKLRQTVERLGLNADCRQLGAWNARDRLPFLHKSGRQAAIARGGPATGDRKSVV